MFRTLAFSRIRINILASRTIHTWFILSIIILVLGARNTRLSVENRSLSRAINTSFQEYIVNLVSRTAQAFSSIYIKIFRMIALDTTVSCPKLLSWACTLSHLIYNLSSFTRLTSFILGIIILVLWTRNTLRTIKNRHIIWTRYALP